MKNILIAGASGMIGGILLEKCLAHADVNQVTSITRKSSGIQHAKLKEVLVDDLMDLTSVAHSFANQDLCFYCIGVYTGQVDKNTFTKITVDFTRSFGTVLKKQSPQAVLCFLSGAGADSKEKSRIQFARDKGIAENFLLGLGLAAVYIFRPGYIYPVVKRKEPNFTYRLMRWLYKPLLSWLYAGGVIPSTRLAAAMFRVGWEGSATTIFENKDIRRL